MAHYKFPLLLLLLLLKVAQHMEWLHLWLIL